MSNLLSKLNELSQLQSELEKECRAYCADESIPLKDRWRVFKLAPNKEHDGYDNIPFEKDLGIDEIVPYDDFGMSRGSTFNVVQTIEAWEKDLKNGWKESFWGKLKPKQREMFKNYYVVKYLGSWNHDW